jgi:hypothetical protein
MMATTAENEQKKMSESLLPTCSTANPGYGAVEGGAQVSSARDSRPGHVLVPPLNAAKQALGKALPQNAQTKTGATTVNTKNKPVIQKQTRTRKAIAAFRKRKDRDYAEWKGRIGVHVQVDELDLKTLDEGGYLENLNQKHGWDYVNHYDVIRLWQRHPALRRSNITNVSLTEDQIIKETGLDAAVSQLDKFDTPSESSLTPRTPHNSFIGPNTSNRPAWTAEEEQLYSYVLQQAEQGGFLTDDSQGQDPNDTLMSALNQMDAATPEVFIFSFGTRPYIPLTCLTETPASEKKPRIFLFFSANNFLFSNNHSRCGCLLELPERRG